MKTKQQLTLEMITDYLKNNSPLKARCILSDFKDAAIEVTGIITKIAKREDLLRLVVEATSKGRQMTVIANFDDGERTEIERLKIKKGSAVSLTGLFQSAGTDTIVLSECYLSI